MVPNDRVQDLLQHLNGIKESIKFTVEVESKGCIPFLDILISRQPDGSIGTSVYRKATHTDKYLDFDSHHLLSHKRSVVNTLQSRAKSHYASNVITTDEMEHISQALQLNRYLRKLLQGHPALSRSGSSNPTEKSKWKSTAVIPYTHGV